MKSVVKSDRKNVDVSNDELAEIVESDDSAYQYLHKGLMALNEKQYEKAISLLNEAIRLDPNHALSHYYLGIAHYLVGNRLRSMEEYHTTIQLDPTHYNATYNLAMMYHADGKYDEAITYYEKAIKISPDSPEPHQKLGLIYAEKGMKEKSVEAYKEAIKIKILQKIGEI